MRKIIVFSMQNNQKKEINTNVETWGQLKPLIHDAGLSTQDMKAMVRETKVSLEHDGAALPEGDCTIFLTASKVKSGK